MLQKTEIESKLKAIKPVLADKFLVSKIGYFGSYAKGVQTTNSYIDLIVEFSQPVGWAFLTLEGFLEQTLGLKVDLVTPNGLRGRIKESILNEVKYIWK